MPRRSPRHNKQGRGESPADDQTGQRLQKVLASSGLGSRRHCEELILSGRVEVDGQVVLELGTRVVPGRQQIRLDGVPLKKPRTVYYLLNKPTGVVTTNNDPSGRERVIDLVPRDHDHIFPVGRLDKSSEGLIIVTNDGELANLLTHPRYGVEKTYQVLVAGVVTHDEMQRLKKGVFLAEGFAKVVRLTVKSQSRRGTMMEIVLDEGRNREIRRLLARVGHKVLKLKRIAIGEVRLADLAPGEYRLLRPEELRSLRALALAARRRPKGTRHAPASSAKPAAKPTASPQGEGESSAPLETSDVDDRFRMSAAAAARKPARRRFPEAAPRTAGTGRPVKLPSRRKTAQQPQGGRPGRSGKSDTRLTDSASGRPQGKARRKPKPLYRKGRRP